MLGESRRHHVAGRVWVQSGLIGVAFGLIGFAITRGLPPLPVVAISALLGVGVSGLLGQAVKLLPLLTTDSEGVGGFDFWFRRRRVGWSEISHVSESNLWPLPCLRIFAKGFAPRPSFTSRRPLVHGRPPLPVESGNPTGSLPSARGGRLKRPVSQTSATHCISRVDGST